MINHADIQAIITFIIFNAISVIALRTFLKTVVVRQNLDLMNPLLSTLGLSVFLVCMASTAKGTDALTPPRLTTSPGKEYAEDTRLFQGIPSIERTDNGRLWAAWYAGGPNEPDEGAGNYVLLVTSGDDGKSWSSPKLVIDPEGLVRAFDPCLWMDPTGCLWLTWSQSYQWYDGRAGVWAITCKNPDEENPTWSEPRRLFDGVMMNKPTVLKNGSWLFPVAVWPQSAGPSTPPTYRHDLKEEKGTLIAITQDEGKSFSVIGKPRIPGRVYDEHMIIEKKDGSLWCLVRTGKGIGESFSHDGGTTWTPGKESPIASASSRFPHRNARFFIRRLKSGNLLLITHNPERDRHRSHLIARISSDDGLSWSEGLLIDEKGISYPDAVQAADGTIYLIYDNGRYDAGKEIAMSTFTEADVLARDWVTPQARKRIVIDHSTGKIKPPTIETTGSSATLEVGTKLFTDSALVLREKQHRLDKVPFIQSSKTGVKISCLEEGLIYAITPAEGEDSQVDALVAAGFVERNHTDTRLFNDETRVRIFNKYIHQGEELRFSSWVLLVLPKGGEIRSRTDK